MLINDLFDKKIYPELKEYIKSHSLYDIEVTKDDTQASEKFPIVIIELLETTNRFNNMKYGDETYNLGIKIDIYNQDMTIGTKRKAKRTVSKEILEIIENYFLANYKLTIRIIPKLANIDSNIYRSRIMIHGKIDTRQGPDKLVIMPK